MQKKQRRNQTNGLKGTCTTVVICSVTLQVGFRVCYLQCNAFVSSIPNSEVSLQCHAVLLLMPDLFSITQFILVRVLVNLMCWFVRLKDLRTRRCWWWLVGTWLCIANVCKMQCFTKFPPPGIEPGIPDFADAGTGGEVFYANTGRAGATNQPAMHGQAGPEGGGGAGRGGRAPGQLWPQNVTFLIRSLIRNDQVYTGLQIWAGGGGKGVYISSFRFSC